MSVALALRVPRIVLVLVLGLGLGSVARAQPAPAPEPAPAGFDPIGPDGWPLGLSLGDLRSLPECQQPLPHTPGAEVTCRPHVDTGGLQWGLGFDWTSGATFGAVPTSGAAQGFGVEWDFAPSRMLQLAVRYELMGMPVPGMSTELAQHFLGEAKLRLWADEIERNGWVLGVGAGYALHADPLGGNAPLVRASLARELGAFAGTDSTVDMAAELAYERTLQDPRLEAVLASLRMGFEVNVAPKGLGEPAPHRWSHTTSLDFLFGPFLGFGLTLGLPVAPHLSLETSGIYMFDFTSDTTIHAYDGASWSAVTGPRLSFGIGYLQAQAGEAWIAHDAGGELRPVGIGELGLRGLVGCTGALEIGTWLRDDLDTGDVVAGGLVFRVGERSGAEASNGCGPRLALMTPPPPPAPVAPPEQTVRVDLTAPHVDIEVPNVHVDANVHVEVPKPEPVVIEVDLGAVLPGGFQVRLDPRLLPLGRLRGAGYITVEISAPGDVASIAANVTGTLSRDGVRVDGVTTVQGESSMIHAKFTIWPPGTHP
ncbi:MAG: hypothetical protein ACM31C_12090 [Acidobacteriota bacterium]